MKLDDRNPACNVAHQLPHCPSAPHLARLESGTLALAVEPRDLVELARAVTLSFTPLAERRGIALRFHSEAEQLQARLDAEQMEKVLLNLLSNAIKFTEPGGQVAVTLRQEEGSAVLTVRDSGIGIAPEKLPRIFERFYQVDGSATRRHVGSGIGLSLVEELVELHGGSISAESRPDAGSSFVVRLPLGAPHPPAPSPTRGEGENTEWMPVHLPLPLHGREGAERGTSEAGVRTTEAEEEDRTTVLVVDDHADIRAYVRSVLEPAREAQPDLVIADLMMPRLDGFSLAQALREEPATDCIPVILLTARAAAEAEIEGLEAGADDYIVKPFHAGVLEARVSALIASRQRLRERFRQEGLPAPAAPAEPAARSELEEQLRAAVEAHLTEPDFNPEALATAADLSYKQLYRRLAAELDATPSQFIRTVRVERAAELLGDGAGSVTEVAYSVGFNSLSHFNRCFRERFGAAPSESLRTPT
ncbi:MAG: helix-turn-helix domain-containing protein [Gemmatimonadetes bacterium]|nr:helix-turn-helix domain-containing protein [Gemmatimonadota bacterium]